MFCSSGDLLNSTEYSEKLHFSMEVLKYFTLMMEFWRRKQKVCLSQQIIFIILKKSRNNLHFCLSAVTIDCNYEKICSSTIKSVSDV